jgi:TonB family protein
MTRSSAFVSLALLVVPCLAHADFLRPYTVTARSTHYRLVVTISDVGHSDVLSPASGVEPHTDVQYTAVVTDLETSAVLSLPSVTLHDNAAGESTLDANGLRFRVSLYPDSMGVGCTLTVIDVHGRLVESLQTPRDDELTLSYPHAYRVGYDVKAPVLIHHVQPVYSGEARQARISGTVIAEAMIDETGVVRDVRILKVLPAGLSEASADALRHWTFKPATLNGMPVPVIFTLSINFKLGSPMPARPE